MTKVKSGALTDSLGFTSQSLVCNFSEKPPALVR